MGSAFGVLGDCWLPPCAQAWPLDAQLAPILSCAMSCGAWLTVDLPKSRDSLDPESLRPRLRQTGTMAIGTAESLHSVVKGEMKGFALTNLLRDRARLVEIASRYIYHTIHDCMQVTHPRCSN
jgi:hypothetical protein